MPNRPERVDAQVYATRQAKADESRAAGIQKLTNYELIDAEAGIVRIPIEDAISLTIASYNSGEGLFAPTEAPLLEIESVSVEELELPIENSSATTEAAFDIDAKSLTSYRMDAETYTDLIPIIFWGRFFYRSDKRTLLDCQKGPTP